MNAQNEPVPFIKYAKYKAQAIGLGIASDLIIQILDDAVLKKQDHAIVRHHIFDCWNRTEQIVREWGGTESVSDTPRELLDLMVLHCREGLQEYLKSLDKYIAEDDAQSG